MSLDLSGQNLYPHDLIISPSFSNNVGGGPKAAFCFKFENERWSNSFFFFSIETLQPVMFLRKKNNCINKNVKLMSRKIIRQTLTISILQTNQEHFLASPEMRLLMTLIQMESHQRDQTKLKPFHYQVSCLI